MRRIKSRSSKGDVKLQLHVDPSFTGVLRGMSNDVSDGCGLRGICTVHVYRGIKIERLVILFEGRCKVKVKWQRYRASSRWERNTKLDF